ncbi:hypothetical protein J6W91_00740 [Candidatus Saccharibacteria bacterium]|nr:hypothetical protein [Candidatus Saccharibacteria bacterium]
MRINNLARISIKTQAVKILFGADNVKDEDVKKASDGIKAIEKLVTTILSQDVLPHAVRIEDAAEIVGGSAKKMRREIKNAIKVSQELYDGFYGRPDINDPDSIVYIVAALTIRENGRIDKDVNTFTAQAMLLKFFKEDTIRSAYDISCYAFLSTYFEDALDHGKKPITKYLKDWGSSFTTKRRLMDLIQRQEWYDNINLLRNLGIDTYGPTLSQVTNAIVERLSELKDKERAKAEEWELHHAFDKK